MPPPTPPRETTEQCKARWERMLQPLVGRTIVAVRYMNAADLDAAMWDRAPVVLSLDDGTHIYPSSDDEGNDAGIVDAQAELHWQETKRLAESWAEEIRTAFKERKPCPIIPAPKFQHVLDYAFQLAAVPPECVENAERVPQI
jgi:hypothetical protein